MLSSNLLSCPVIELRGVSVNYAQGRPVLLDTNLAFERGLVYVILGPSGAGKTTLLRSLNGLVLPQQGEVRSAHGALRGSRAWREHRRTTGMMFQQHNLLPKKTVLHNVLCGRLGYHPVWRSLLPAPLADRRLALETLAAVGLLEKSLERAERLSVGQQQRVGLARALAQKPEVLLADEPIASLDPATAQQVLSLISSVSRERGITAIISLHQVELARIFADRIIGLAKGRVVFQGTPDQLGPDALQQIYGTEAVPESDSIPITV